MNKEQTEQAYREYLEGLPLSTLRTLGRMKGVTRASSSSKTLLVDEIVGVCMGRVVPAPPSKRGAPAKEKYVDPSILSRLNAIARNWDEPYEIVEEEPFKFRVSSGNEERFIHNDPTYSGLLEITQGGYGFLRARNCQPSSTGEDVFLPAPFIHSNKLREGDLIVCTATPRQQNDAAAVDQLIAVNGIPVGRYDLRPQFDLLTAQYPNEKIELSKDCKEISLRLIDLFAPVGKGQRGLIIAPPKAGKTTLLKQMARALALYHPDIYLMVLLVDERPEEVTDFRESVPTAEVYSSTFDEGAEHHIRVAGLTLEHAKRFAEHGRDVVLLLDSLTKLTRAYNFMCGSSGKTLSGGLDAGAFVEPKKFFGSARNLLDNGSLTILSTVLVETGSRMDDIIYEEFKGTGNSDIFLSRDLAERRIYPSLDLRRSGTRKEELLLSQEELAAVFRLRERRYAENTAGLIEMMKRTENNKEFIARLPEWLRVCKNG